MLYSIVLTQEGGFCEEKGDDSEADREGQAATTGTIHRVGWRGDYDEGINRD
jgi:hypothetical protein